MAKIDWVRRYNALFEAINQHGAESYFSGPRFIRVIQEFDEGFINYQQYIEYRNQKSLSTSRKVYFFDILSAFKDDVRDAIVDRIYQIIDDNKAKADTQEIQITPAELVSAQEVEKAEELTTNEIFDDPVVFISYSWDSEDHKTWVLNLAKRLLDNGIEVLLDRYTLKGGANAPVFMERSLAKANKVLVIFTPNYKLKADKRHGGVGVEYSILNNDIYRNIADNSKYIPVLRSGSFQDSIPDFIKQFIAIDMTDDSQYEEKIRELTLVIYNKPIVEKPAKGGRPAYI